MSATNSSARNNFTLTPSSSCIGQNICLYGRPVNGNMIFTVHSSANGWAGVALGSQMAGSDYYIGWKNSTSGITLSRRTAGGDVMPQFSRSQIATVVPLDVAAPSWAKLSFSFSRAIESDNSILATSPFIYGQSDSAPGSINDPQSSFPRHSLRGNFKTVNYLSLGNSASGSAGTPILSSTPEQYNNIVVAHGVLFFLAWCISPFIGIFIARYLKDKLGVWWYRLHLGFMFGVTGVFSIVSLALIYLYKTPAHFNDTHSILGLTIVISLIGQIILGFVSNHMWTADRESVPWWDQLHWWLGRTLFVLGLLNIFFGLQEFKSNGFTVNNTGMIVGYWVIVAIGIMVLVSGEFLIGQINHVAHPSNSDNNSNTFYKESVYEMNENSYSNDKTFSRNTDI